MKRGQSVIATILITGGTIASAIVAGWATSNQQNQDMNARISGVQAQVEVTQEREQNHYAEVQKDLNRIEAKLDRALGQ